MFKLDKMLNFRELFYLHVFFKQRKVFVNVNYNYTLPVWKSMNACNVT